MHSAWLKMSPWNIKQLFSFSWILSSNDEKTGKKTWEKQGDTHSVLHMYPDYILQQKGKISSDQIKYVIRNASVRNSK